MKLIFKVVGKFEEIIKDNSIISEIPKINDDVFLDITKDTKVFHGKVVNRIFNYPMNAVFIILEKTTF